MSDLQLNCPHCQARVTAARELSGQVVVCPECGGDMVVPRPKPPALPTPAVTDPPEPETHFARSGWICFGFGILLAVVLFVIPIWAALLLAGLVLGILAAAHKEKGGVALLISSIVALPVTALVMSMVMVVGGVGILATGLQEAAEDANRRATSPRINATQPANKPTRPPRKPAAKTPERRPADLGNLLCRLDVFAREIEKAPTTVLKDDAMSRFHKEGVAMFGNTEIELETSVKDIKMLGSGRAELSFNGVNLGTYSAQKQKAMNVGLVVNPKVKIPITADKARQIRPGQPLKLRVAPTFVPRNDQNFLSTVHSSYSDLFTITVKGPLKLRLGYNAGIRIKLLAYSVKLGDGSP